MRVGPYDSRAVNNNVRAVSGSSKHIRGDEKFTGQDTVFPVMGITFVAFKSAFVRQTTLLRGPGRLCHHFPSEKYALGFHTVFCGRQWRRPRMSVIGYRWKRFCENRFFSGSDYMVSYM